MIWLIALAADVSVFSQPPLKYQHDAIAPSVRFMERRQIHPMCRPGVDKSIHGVIVACTNTETRQMTLPNPCGWRWQRHMDPYAELVCHELGHVNGWRGDHKGARQHID